MTFVKTYSSPPVRRNEILRYAGVKREAPEIQALMEACLKEADSKLIYRVCYKTVPVSCRENILDFGFAQTPSRDLTKNMTGCDQAILFAATVGVELDMLIARYSHISPAKALLFNAIGAERIESLCDAFQKEMRSQAAQDKLFLHPRFSPGYGDLPLTFQKDIFRTLDCHRKIGLTLNESLVMSPSKSVTAFMGIGKKECSEHSGCDSCGKQDCAYRRTE